MVNSLLVLALCVVEISSTSAPCWLCGTTGLRFPPSVLLSSHPIRLRSFQNAIWDTLMTDIRLPLSVSVSSDGIYPLCASLFSSSGFLRLFSTWMDSRDYQYFILWIIQDDSLGIFVARFSVNSVSQCTKFASSRSKTCGKGRLKRASVD